MPVIAKRPLDWTHQDRTEFHGFAVRSKEVQEPGLAALINDAKALAFLEVDGKRIGIGGLKRARDLYRTSVFSEAKSKCAANDFGYELGWVFVEAQQGNGHSRPIVEELLKHAAGAGVYATSRTTQPRMHSTLTRYGFVPEGRPWPSKRRDESLLLFVRRAAGMR